MVSWSQSRVHFCATVVMTSSSLSLSSSVASLGVHLWCLSGRDLALNDTMIRAVTRRKKKSPLPLLIKFCVFLYLQSLSRPCTLRAPVCVSACVSERMCVFVYVCVRDTPQGAWERSSCGQKENTHVSFGFHRWLVQRGIWQSAEKLGVNVCIGDHMSCEVVCPVLLHACYLLLCHYLQALCLAALLSLRIYNFKRQL